MTNDDEWPQVRGVYLGAWAAEAGLARTQLAAAGFAISEPQDNTGSQGLATAGVEATVRLASEHDEQRFIEVYTNIFGGPPWEPSPIEKIMAKWRKWRGSDS